MNRLKELRKERNLTLTELNEATNISRSVLSAVENGTRRMNVNHARVLGEYFGVSTDYILGNDLASFMSFSDALEDLFTNSFDSFVQAANEGKLEERQRLLFSCVDLLLHGTLTHKDLSTIKTLLETLVNKNEGEGDDE
jgi:transcriptional regulator with XRE-family HTH domain